MSNYSYDDYDNYDGYDDDGGFGYSQSELDSMYLAAFEGEPDAYWNID